MLNEQIITDLFQDGSLKTMLAVPADPWIGTPFEGYKYLGNTQKGDFGEAFIKHWLRTKYELNITDAPGRKLGYDALFGSMKLEFKFSLAQSDNKLGITIPDRFTFNHISGGKDWDYAICLGINRDFSSRVFVFSNADFIENLKSPDAIFNRQQGGKDGGNDDWMCTITSKKRLAKILAFNWVHDLSIITNDETS